MPTVRVIVPEEIALDLSEPTKKKKPTTKMSENMEHK